jgi:integrase
MARRSAGEGNIRQRKNGTWEGRYTAANGRTRSIYAKTKREATDRLRHALGDAVSGILPVSRQLTTADYLDAWLATLTVRPRTAESYRGIVRRYLKPAIGRVPLAKLQPEHIMVVVRDLEQREPSLSATTIRYVYVVLRIALGRALKLGHVTRNVCSLIDPPAKTRTERQPMSAEQARVFLASVTGDRHQTLYRLAIASGLRQGELLGLRWQDVDLDTGTLTVRHTLQQGTRTLAVPKTERSRRTVALDADTADALRVHRRRQVEERLAAGGHWHDLDFIFATSIGTAMSHRNLVRAFHAALARAGLPRQHFHDLRHASATLGIEAGESLYEVSRRLGHANISTTADVYGHLTPATTRRSAERMRDILAG